MALPSYVIEVLNSIASTVDGGVYNLISRTPVNPLLLDNTALQLLEQQAGTTLTPLLNDAGEIIGYTAKGVASGGNGAAAEVSTYIKVLAEEVTVDSEMAAGTFIDAATGETAALTVGEEVTTIGAGSTGAGILAMDVGLAGAAIAPALGIAAGFGLYNIAPSFWDSVADRLMEAGELVGGKVQGLFDSSGKTSFNENVIEIMKNQFLFYDMYEEEIQPQPLEGITCEGTIHTYPLPNGEMIVPWNTDWENPQKCWSVPNGVVRCSGYDENGTTIMILASSSPGGYWRVYSDAQHTGVYLGIDCDTHEVLNGKDVYWGASADPYDWWSSGKYPLPIVTPYGNTGKYIGYWMLYGVPSGGSIQQGATIPTEDEPFNVTFPSWLPNFNFNNKKWYPTSLPTDDITQNDSQTGDNAQPSQEDNLFDLIINIPDIDPTIKPELDPDVDPDVDPEEPLPQPVIPSDDPIDPNEPVVDPTTPPVTPILDTTNVDRMATIYNPTDAQVNSLGAFLWTTNIIEQIKHIWGDPMDAIIAFHKVYCTPTTGGNKNIVLGYVDSGVAAKEVTNQFATVDCGSITVSERLHNATDYSPFVQAQLYLPFIGITEIDVTDIMDGTISITYKIDVYTGTCVALVYVTRSPDMPDGQLLYSYSGNCSQQLPLTSATFGGAVSALLGLAGAGVAVASGGAAGVAMGAIGAAHSLTHEMVHLQHSGGLAGNAGIMSPRNPFLILSRQNGYDANAYSSFYGLPANKTVYLSNCSGFTQVKFINYQGNATEKEKAEIISILKDGVII